MRLMLFPKLAAQVSEVKHIALAPSVAPELTHFLMGSAVYVWTSCLDPGFSPGL